MGKKQFSIFCIKLGAFLLIAWLVIHFFSNIFSQPIDLTAQLLHDGRYLIVPEKSTLRQVITVKPIKKENIAVPYIMPAMIQPDPKKVLSVLTPVAGRILDVKKRPGDPVKKGEVLFLVSSMELASAVNDYKQAQAGLVLAEQNLKRQKQLAVSDLGVQHDLEEAQRNYTQAMSELYRSRSVLKTLQAKQDSAQPSILAVHSPMNGYVNELRAGQGAYWTDLTDPVMTIVDLSTVQLNVSVQERFISKVHLGQTLDVKFDAYPQPIQTKIEYMMAMLDPQTRTLSVGVLLDNTDECLRPNMFAKAKVMVEAEDRIMLPLTAIIRRGFDVIAFVEVAPWKFEPRTITLGLQIDNRVEVVSGLQHNDRVAFTGSMVLND